MIGMPLHGRREHADLKSRFPNIPFHLLSPGSSLDRSLLLVLLVAFAQPLFSVSIFTAFHPGPAQLFQCAAWSWELLMKPFRLALLFVLLKRQGRRPSRSGLQLSLDRCAQGPGSGHGRIYCNLHRLRGHSLRFLLFHASFIRQFQPAQ